MEKGLSSEEAARRLAESGPNRISIKKEISPLAIFINQFRNTLVILLLLAAIVSLAISYYNPEKADPFDALLIFAIVVANAVFGFVQEYKAERSIEALERMAAPRATVLRDGREVEIDSADVVPGDILIVREGDKVAADAKLLESFSLYLDESFLSGESVPVNKAQGKLLYKDSIVTRGRGTAVVAATGLKTEVGKIAKEIAEAPQKVTRFQVEIGDVGDKVAKITLVILLIIAATEFMLRSGDILSIFIAAVALGVAAIPEGLPAVVTLALSIATSRMLKQGALMRRLSTVQDLGSVDVVCTDKTGTLTENAMTVTRIFSGGSYTELSGKGLERNGEFSGGGVSDILLKCALLCNDAREIEGKFKGDPTEIALMMPAIKAGMDTDSIRRTWNRVGEISFSPERKMMSTANSDGKETFVFAKGASEIILSRCTHILAGAKARKITEKDRKEILESNQYMASSALRVLAFAYKGGTESYEENGLTFLGLMGMKDPPRAGVDRAIKDCRSAGIRVVMITGDHPYTAMAIGHELGFGGKVITGDELDRLGMKELATLVEEVDIYARTSPKHKVMLLKALKENNHVVCMTGDGVNDAAAIKNSDVGIAMGIRGTEVTKQASDMVVLDDNFITIRNAIAEGRSAFDNISKFVVYLIGCNISEVLIIFAASVTALGISPKIAIQLLWINLATDGLPALALGVDPPSKDVMERKPRPKDERIVGRKSLYFMLSIGLSATISLITMYALSGGIRGQTMLFAGFVVLEMIAVYFVRRRYGYSMLANKWLHLSVLSSLILTLAILYSPINSYFGTIPLAITDWGVIAVAMIGFIALAGIMLAIEPLISRKRPAKK